MGELKPFRLSATAERIEFRLFGSFSARRVSDGAEITPRSRKARALLAYLLIEKGSVDRDRLAGLLWSERGEAQARASLRQCLFELRSCSPEIASIIDAGRQQLAIKSDDVDVDLDHMLDLAAREDADELASCLAAAGTTLLEGLDGTDSAFDQWLRPVRSSKTESLLAAGCQCCRTALQSGSAEAALRLAKSLQANDRLDESIARLAMEAAHATGQQEHVRRVFVQLQADLKIELGVDPSPETLALHAELLGGGRTSGDSRLQGRPTDLPAAVTAAPATATIEAHPAQVWWRGWHGWVAASLLLLLASATLVISLPDRISAVSAPASSSVSLAVLPFRNLAGDDDYLAEGVADDVLSELARQPNFRIAGRSSAWLYRDRAVNFSEMGQRLGVDYVLEGSVSRSGERLRFDIAIVRTRDGIALWSRSLAGHRDRLAVIQGQIVRAVSGELSGENAGIVSRSPNLVTSGEVYGLYVKARSLLRDADQQKAKAAVPLLKKAVKLDPNYAPAWALLAHAIGAELGFFADSSERSVIRAEAAQYARRAVKLAPKLAESHAALGQALNFNRESLSHFERAARLDPHNAEIWFGLYLARENRMDQEGALRALRRVATIDPLWEGSRFFPDMAWSMGFHEEAEDYYRRAIAAHPDAWRREGLRADRAKLRTDWSAYVRHSMAAARLAAPGQKARSSYHVGSGLLRLGYIEEGRRHLPNVTELIIEVRRAKAPTLQYLRERFSDPREFWSNYETFFVPALLVNAKRSDDLLLFYDRAFSSPEDMIEVARGELWTVSRFLYDAPTIAIALREEGRNREAERILELAEHMAVGIVRRGRTDIGMHFLCTRIWAVQGKRDAAVNALAKVEAAGLPHWQYIGTHFQPRLVDDPALRSLRDHPPLRRMDAAIQSHLAKERRELQTALRMQLATTTGSQRMSPDSG